MPVRRVGFIDQSAEEFKKRYNELGKRLAEDRKKLDDLSVEVELEILQAKAASNDAGQWEEKIIEFLSPIEFKLYVPPGPVAAAAKPPRIVEGVFWLVLPRKHREAIIGDAAEAYDQTLKRYGGRRWMATVDYIKEAVFASIAAFRMSVAQWVELILKRSS